MGVTRVSKLDRDNRDNFLSLRVTDTFRALLQARATESMRSMSAQALYLIQFGMEADTRRSTASGRAERAERAT